VTNFGVFLSCVSKLVVVCLSRNKMLFLYSGCCLALSRILQMLSFFLPLKVLMLLSAESVPSYMKDLNGFFSHQEVLILFTALVPVAYLSYILFGILYRKSFDADQKGGWGAVSQFLDMRFSENQLKTLHGNLLRMTSDFLVIVVSIISLLFISLSVAAYVSISSFFLFLAFDKYSFSIKEVDRISCFRLHRRQYIEYLVSINFVLIFGVLAMISMHSSYNIYSILLALLVSRLSMQALQRFAFECLQVRRLLG